MRGQRTAEVTARSSHDSPDATAPSYSTCFAPVVMHRGVPTAAALFRVEPMLCWPASTGAGWGPACEVPLVDAVEALSSAPWPPRTSAVQGPESAAAAVDPFYADWSPPCLTAC